MAIPNNPTQAQTVKAIKDLETNKADSSALSSYFPKSGGALNSGAVITMTGGNPYLGLKETSGTQYYLQGYQGEVGISVSGSWGTKRISLDSNGKVTIPSKSLSDGTYTYTLPSKTGTVAMTSDIPTSYVSSVNGQTGAVTVPSFPLTLTLVATVTSTKALNTLGLSANTMYLVMPRISGATNPYSDNTIIRFYDSSSTLIANATVPFFMELTTATDHFSFYGGTTKTATSVYRIKNCRIYSVQ